MNMHLYRRPYGYDDRQFFGLWGLPLGFLGGLAAGSLIRPPYYPYPPYPYYYQAYPYYGGFYW